VPAKKLESCGSKQSFAVKADDHLIFDFMKSGARSYIAVAGGIDVPVETWLRRPQQSPRLLPTSSGFRGD
jgi:hypothetical protein